MIELWVKSETKIRKYKNGRNRCARKTQHQKINANTCLKISKQHVKLCNNSTDQRVIQIKKTVESPWSLGGTDLPLLVLYSTAHYSSFYMYIKYAPKHIRVINKKLTSNIYCDSTD